jgi:GBP family porin
MNRKSCLPAFTALLAATGAVQAQSSVTLYGTLGTDVISASKVYNPSSGTTGSVVRLDDNAMKNSRLGFKGVEDLGGGLSAVFGLEAGINPDTGATRTPFWNRGSYVGLAGGFGSIKLGHQWNVADDYMGNYFVFDYYSPFLMSGFYALSDYYDNAIKYNSPNIGGFEGGLYYSMGEQVGGSKTRGQKMQAALVYQNSSPFSAGLTAFSEKDPTGLAPSNTMYAGGASYDFNVAKARFGYAVAEVNYSASTPFKARLYDLGVDVPISSVLLSLDYVKKEVRHTDDDTSFVRLRATYLLSKRTNLNANLIHSKNSGAADFAFVTNGNGFSGLPGQSQSLVTLGISHSF